MRRLMVGAFLVVSSLITACGGGGGTVAAEPAGTVPETTPAEESGTTGNIFAAFPSAEELAKLPAGVDDMTQSGASYFSALPHLNVERWFGAAHYYNGLYADEDALACGVYRFDLTELRGDPTPQTINLDFSAISFSADPPNFYVGLSNWGESTWDWFPAYISEYVDLGDLTEYIQADTGHCYLALAFIGPGLFNLTELELGKSNTGLPYTYQVIPEQAVTGDEVQFIPDPMGAEPLEFYWDFGAAFSPSTSTEREPVVTAMTAGTIEYSVVLSNRYGEREQFFTIEVIDNSEPWVQTLIHKYDDDLYSQYSSNCWRCTSDIYNRLHLIDYRTGVYETTEYNSWRAMSLDQCGRGFPEVNLEYTEAEDLHPAGQFQLDSSWADWIGCQYIGGSSPDHNEETAAFVHRFGGNQLGPIWLVMFSPAHLVGNTHGVTDTQTNTHVAAYSVDPANANGTTLVTLNYQGEIIRTLGWRTVYDCRPQAAAIDLNDNIIVAGNVSQAAGDGTYLVKVNPDGELVSQKFLAGTGDPLLTVSRDGQYIFLAGNQGPATITALDGNLEQSWVYTYAAGSSLSITSIAAGEDGNLHALAICTGLTAGQPGTDYLLLTISPTGEVDHFKSWVSTAEFSEITSIATGPGGDVYAAGTTTLPRGNWELMTGNFQQSVGETLTDDTLDLTLSTPVVVTSYPMSFSGGTADYYIDTYSTSHQLLVNRVTP